MLGAPSNPEEQLLLKELAQIEVNKKQLNKAYTSLLLNPKQSIVPFLDIVVHEIIDNDTTPTNLLKIAIKTLLKVFEHVDPQVHLLKHSDLRNPDSNFKSNDSSMYYNPQNLLVSLMGCQLDDHSNSIHQ